MIEPPAEGFGPGRPPALPSVAPGPAAVSSLVALLLLLGLPPSAAGQPSGFQTGVNSARDAGGSAEEADAPLPRLPDLDVDFPGGESGVSALLHARGRLEVDLAAMRAYRPGYPFWRHVFAIPDGRIAVGSAADGRLLAVFPARGDWSREGRWEDPSLASALEGRRLPSSPRRQRERVVELLEASAGPLLHNGTRGDFLSPRVPRYGPFLREWGAIYEHFGIPAEIGLAQATIESGLSGTVRSEAGAIGFCQWLGRNWTRLARHAPNVIEARNQTTQAAYCAAYLTVLATKYGSFIPAVSEHHAGGTNVGRILVLGERLGGEDVRERYFRGGEFALDLRKESLWRFRELYRTYGPRSHRYAEMVFANAATVAELAAGLPQEPIHAMRAPRSIPLAEVARRSGLSVDEVRRYNPALSSRVPAGADLYLPSRVPDFGPDVAFWHRAPDPGFAAVLNDFVRLDAEPAAWDEPGFEPVLRDFRRRFLATGTEPGAVMAAVLGYVAEDTDRSRRAEILSDYRRSREVERLFGEGLRLLGRSPGLSVGAR